MRNKILKPKNRRYPFGPTESEDLLDFGSLEEWAHGVQHDQDQGPLPGMGQSPTSTQAGGEGIESSPMEKHLGILVDKKF